MMSRGCFGCCTKPTPVTAVDEPSKGLRIQGQKVKKPSLSEDFWSTSTCDIDNSTVQSQRSISSISAYQTPSGTGSTSEHAEFTNHGLLLWNQNRLQWIGNGASTNERQQQIQERKLGWTATYNSLLGTSRPFSQRIPLSEMIDFLVDVWDQEGFLWFLLPLNRWSYVGCLIGRYILGVSLPRIMLVALLGDKRSSAQP